MAARLSHFAPGILRPRVADACPAQALIRVPMTPRIIEICAHHQRVKAAHRRIWIYLLLEPIRAIVALEQQPHRMFRRLLRVARRIALHPNAAIRLEPAVVVGRNEFHRARPFPLCAPELRCAFGHVRIDAVVRTKHVVHADRDRHRRQRFQRIEHQRTIGSVRHDLGVHLKITRISLPIIAGGFIGCVKFWARNRYVYVTLEDGSMFAFVAIARRTVVLLICIGPL